MEYYLEHFKGDEVFCRQILDIKERVEDQYISQVTPFLDPHQQEIVASLIGKHQGVSVKFDGGFDNAEMKRAIIYPSVFEIEDDEFEVSVLSVKYPGKFVSVSHRDVLGALMNLGLKRELYGDIIVDDQYAYFACDSKMEDYLMQNLTMVGRGSVKVDKINQRLERKQDYKKVQVSVASFRLDLIIAEAFNLSRSEASKYINGNFVKVNYKEVVQTNYLCHNMDIISLRRHGRIKLVDLNKINRKQKHVIEVWFYK